MSKMVVKVMVIAFILWTNLAFSIGEDYDNNNSGGGGHNNETEQIIDWDYEAIVAVRWDIGKSPTVQYSKLRFDISFSVSDYIEAEKHVRYDIYENAECGDADDIITDSDGYMKSWVTEDNTPVGPGIDENKKRIVTVSNQLVAQTIKQSKAYSEDATATGNDASITYCVRFSLWNGEGTSDPGATEINHLAVTVQLSLDLTDEDFSITGQKVEALERGVETSDDQFFVEAFICDKRGKPPSIFAGLQQGESVRICVQPTEQAAEVGFRMQRIETFNFVQGITSQGAILNAEASPNLLTDLTCQPGSKQCMFETLLFSHFYENTPQGIVLGSGEATLQWGGEGIYRRLRFNIESNVTGSEYIGREMYAEIQEDVRLLQERASTKTVQVPTFAIVADGTKRPRLLADAKSTAKTQQIVLTSLLLIFCIVLFLPLVYYSRRQMLGTSSKTMPECLPVQQENELSIFDDVLLSIIPEDRTIVSVKSVKSFLSKGL